MSVCVSSRPGVCVFFQIKTTPPPRAEAIPPPKPKPKTSTPLNKPSQTRKVTLDGPSYSFLFFSPLCPSDLFWSLPAPCSLLSCLSFLSVYPFLSVMSLCCSPALSLFAPFVSFPLGFGLGWPGPYTHPTPPSETSGGALSYPRSGRSMFFTRGAGPGPTARPPPPSTESRRHSPPGRGGARSDTFRGRGRSRRSRAPLPILPPAPQVSPSLRPSARGLGRDPCPRTGARRRAPTGRGRAPVPAQR